MRVVAEILAVPGRQTGAAPAVLEKHRPAVEVDLCCPDQPDKFFELVRKRHWQICATGIVGLAEYQGIALREWAKSHLHIEIRCRPDYPPGLRKKAKSTTDDSVGCDGEVSPAHCPGISHACGDCPIAPALRTRS